MDRWVRDDKVEIRSAQRIRREQRRLARQFAREHTAQTLAPLVKAPPPDWFSEEMTRAYAEAVQRLYQRLAPRTLARVARA